MDQRLMAGLRVVKEELRETDKPRVYTVLEVPVGDKLLWVHSLRAENLPEHFNSVGFITIGKLDLFNFKEEGYVGSARLHMHPEPLITICKVTKPGARLEDVILSVLPLSDLLSSTIIELPDGSKKRTGLRSAEKLYDLKMLLSTNLKQKYELSAIEQLIQKKRVKEREALLATQKAQNEKLQRERAERIIAINARERITVYGLTGKPFDGLPVQETEIWLVNSGTHVIIVDEKGAPIKYFYLAKKYSGGRMEKLGESTGLTLTKPKMPAAPNLSALGELYFDLPEFGFTTAFHYESGNGIIEKLLAKGVNSGTCVAIGNPTAAGELAIHCLKDGTATAIGHYKPLEV